MAYHKPGSTVKIVGGVRDKYSKRLGIDLPEYGKVAAGSATDDGMYVDFNQEHKPSVRVFIKSKDLEALDAKA